MTITAVRMPEDVFRRLIDVGFNGGDLDAPAEIVADDLIDITVIDIARVVDGRLVEHWGVADRLTMLTQMGLQKGRQPS